MSVPDNNNMGKMSAGEESKAESIYKLSEIGTTDMEDGREKLNAALAGWLAVGDYLKQSLEVLNKKRRAHEENILLKSDGDGKTATNSNKGVNLNKKIKIDPKISEKTTADNTDTHEDEGLSKTTDLLQVPSTYWKSIFIKGNIRRLKDSNIIRAFESFGEINHVSKINKQIAKITFKNRKIAYKLLKQKTRKIYGRQVEILSGKEAQIELDEQNGQYQEMNEETKIVINHFAGCKCTTSTNI